MVRTEMGGGAGECRPWLPKVRWKSPASYTKNKKGRPSFPTRTLPHYLSRQQQPFAIGLCQQHCLLTTGDYFLCGLSATSAADSLHFSVNRRRSEITVRPATMKYSNESERKITSSAGYRTEYWRDGCPGPLPKFRQPAQSLLPST